MVEIETRLEDTNAGTLIKIAHFHLATKQTPLPTTQDNTSIVTIAVAKRVPSSDSTHFPALEMGLPYMSISSTVMAK